MSKLDLQHGASLLATLSQGAGTAAPVGFSEAVLGPLIRLSYLRYLPGSFSH